MYLVTFQVNLPTIQSPVLRALWDSVELGSSELHYLKQPFEDFSGLSGLNHLFSVDSEILSKFSAVLSFTFLRVI